jgi:hypothetical protein
MAERRDTRLRFEQWARNPSCTANTLSAVHGIPMAEVARREGVTPTMGQSPFAIARGQTFERGLFWDQAKSLREALVEAKVLPAGSTGFADFRMRQHGGRMTNLDAARLATTELLRAIAAGVGARRTAELPTILAAATILIPAGVMLPEALLVVDVTTVAYQKNCAVLTVGEIKTYPDRGGHTDGGELATARAQAGVYVHGLRLVLDELGLQDRIQVAETGFLVLSRPGFNRPSIRAGEDLRYQARRAARGFQQLEAAAMSLPVPGEQAGPEAILAAPTDYCEACVSFCDRAPVCFAKAMEAGDAVILGEDVRRFLGAVTLPRALELLAGARPRTLAEKDLMERLPLPEDA